MDLLIGGSWVGLARHRRATFVALTATLDTLVHIADLLATVRARLADFCTRFAVVRVEVAVAGHEVDAGSARCDTVKHQFDVGLIDVVAA